MKREYCDMCNTEINPATVENPTNRIVVTIALGEAEICYSSDVLCPTCAKNYVVGFE